MANAKEQEIWRTYPEFPWIEASNLGRVRTKDRVVMYKNGAKHFYKAHILRQYLRKNGYLQVQVKVNGKSINLSVHRIVAVCFVSNPNNYPEVNHIDCDRTNNRWDNLEWCTHQENIKYCVELGHWINNNPGRPVIAINLDSLKVLWFESQSEASRQLDVNLGNMNSVIKGKLNKTKGFWFYLADENAVEKQEQDSVTILLKRLKN